MLLLSKVRTLAKFVENQPRPLSHFALSQSDDWKIGLSCTDRPLSHRSVRQRPIWHKISLSHIQPLPQNHVTILSQSDLSCTWPLLHRSASLAQIGLSCTDQPLSLILASLTHGLSHTDRPLLHRSASLTHIGLSHTRPLSYRSASLAQIT